MEALNNPWVIGIGGGILSGLFVTLITRYLFSKRDNREYVQRIVTANQEILYAVRPGISEGVIPTSDVVGALIKTTASKYGVAQDDVYSPSQLADVLVKEVMDTSFLSAQAKAEFCAKLAQLRPQPIVNTRGEPKIEESRRPTPELAEYRQRMVAMMSGMLGLLAGVLTGSVALLSWFKDSHLQFDSKNLIVALPTALTLVVAFLATYFTWAIRAIERKKREHNLPKSARHTNPDETEGPNKSLE